MILKPQDPPATPAGAASDDRPFIVLRPARQGEAFIGCRPTTGSKPVTDKPRRET